MFAFAGVIRILGFVTLGAILDDGGWSRAVSALCAVVLSAKLTLGLLDWRAGKGHIGSHLVGLFGIIAQAPIVLGFWPGTVRSAVAVSASCLCHVTMSLLAERAGGRRLRDTFVHDVFSAGLIAVLEVCKVPPKTARRVAHRWFGRKRHGSQALAIVALALVFAGGQLHAGTGWSPLEPFPTVASNTTPTVPTAPPPTAEVAAPETIDDLVPERIDTTTAPSAVPTLRCDDLSERLRRLLPSSQADAAELLILRAWEANTGCPPDRSEKVGAFTVLTLEHPFKRPMVILIDRGGTATLVTDSAVPAVMAAIENGSIVHVSGPFANAGADRPRSRNAFLYVLQTGDDECLVLVRTMPQPAWLAVPPVVVSAVFSSPLPTNTVPVVNAVISDNQTLFTLQVVNSSGVVDSSEFALSSLAEEQSGASAGSADSCAAAAALRRSYPDGDQFVIAG
jgi:hypothetical protein